MNFLHIFHYCALSFYNYTINQYIYLFEKKEQKLKNSLEQSLQRSLKHTTKMIYIRIIVIKVIMDYLFYL